jgi:hypothetical protein
VPRSPQGGRRIERSLTSQTPWRSAVPPLPVPQGSGRDTADSGSGQTPAARCALRCASATAGGIDPPGRASGQVERRARATALRNVPRRGTKPMEDEVSCVRQRSCGASTRQRSNASKAAVSRGGGCEGPATDRRSFALGTRRKNAWRSASADSSPSVFSAPPIPGSWCARARRVLRSERATERQGGNGRGDTVRLLARESSGGMNASRGRGDVHSARDGNVVGRVTRRRNAPNPSR